MSEHVSYKSNKKIKKILFLFFFFLLIAALYFGYKCYSGIVEYESSGNSTTATASVHGSISNEIPEYSGKQYVEVNGNVPYFSETSTKSFAKYTGFDDLGRTGSIEACIGPESISTEERDDISKIHPTGWKQEKYPYTIGGNGYLYQRCHLLGHQLGGDDKDYNLITGTAYFNAGTAGEGTSADKESGSMLTFENKVRYFVEDNNCHVMYRVAPIYNGSDLVCKGVQIEAQSVEENGLSFNVFVFNVQPGVTINYSTGASIEEQ